MGGAASRELRVQLQSILADLYPTNERALELAARTGLAIADIAQSPRPKTTWWAILEEADHQLLLERLIDLARADYPRHDGLRAAREGRLADVSGPDVEWAKPPGEVIVEVDDLLPVAFLEVGAAIAHSVVRIGLGAKRYGTGFLIAPDRVLTNHHVLPDAEVAAAAVIEVGCQETLAGVAIAGTVYRTRPGDTFAADEADDWAVVACEPVPDASPIPLAGAAKVAVNDRVFIVQHPGGGPKQVALGSNTVTFVDDKRIQYLTDTRPGSSGSPVFDRSWRLVGLHHSGGWMSEPTSKAMKFRNEGIAIGTIHEALRKVGVVKG